MACMGRPIERDHFEDLGIERKIILKWGLLMVRWRGLDSSSSGQGQVAGSCNSVLKLLITHEEFFCMGLVTAVSWLNKAFGPLVSPCSLYSHLLFQYYLQSRCYTTCPQAVTRTLVRLGGSCIFHEL